jgi:hypothetical protein
MHAVVVGTGPAATACTKALVRRGARVTVLDAGDSLDAERASLAGKLAASEPAGWDRKTIAHAIENPTIAALPIPRKLLFGSDFFYGTDRAYWPMRADGVAAAPSFARGGYTVAWGAAMLPADDCDLAGWPIKRADLAASYRRVLEE